ncbi:hypothetical protein Moror_7423 [Moniliophthora roreri MCA 2997]|uniref:Uncharacterized protein n=1 Tax=Moniliophthora roreri (strain MCA 2997) TaxID=1381753 RepID=V2XA53_MONRO|nr:hypothetical protein Moror_7423 [Moniliophthora roreri MCA 2997]
MRRLASIFSSSSKRDKSDSQSSLTPNSARRPRTNLSLSKKKNIRTSINTRDLPSSFDSTLSTPQLSTSSDRGQSSASSTGSASLQTPEELPAPITSNAKGREKLWVPFLGKRPSSIKPVETPPLEEDWTPRTALPKLRQPPAGKRPPLGEAFESESEELEDEIEDDDEEYEEDHTLGPLTANPVLRSREVLRAMTLNSLQHRPSLPPFVERPGLPLYPRSCNSSRGLQKRTTLEASIHKRRLLRRFRDDDPLTRQEEASILPFHTKRISTLFVAEEPPVNETIPSKSDKVLHFSPGLRKWISRPPFEDRLCIWLPIDETLTCKRVSSALAVAALEYSEVIEAMAYSPRSHSLSPPLQRESSMLPPEASVTSLEPPSSSSSSSSHQSISHPRSAPHLLAPSPLRNEANSATVPVASPAARAAEPPKPSSSPRSPSPTNPTGSMGSAGTVKRGVRFAEDEKEDNIPIGYVMRIKKQKEQKARFLREEKERRQFEEERRRVEEERRRRDQERIEWEKERKAWEREKKAMEEERKSRLYAEEVIASRQRAESSRTGMKISTGSSSSLRDAPERPAQDSRRYSRLPFDSAPQTSRNQGSDSASSPHTPSPGSSRPPSIVGNPVQHARPSSFHSTHTASSEDVRLSGPGSTASAPSGSGRARGPTYPAWSASHSSLLIPPVPPLPVMFPTDMPLLPPSAPFMMNSYPRPRSNQSPSRSSSRNRLSTTSNSSSDRVNQIPLQHPRSGSSPHRPNFASQSSASSLPQRQGHHRRTSDDSITRRSQSSHTQIPSSYSQHSLPRGRSLYNEPPIPDPWTAMPTQTGVIPTAMPYYPPKMTPSRRQTTLS